MKSCSCTCYIVALWKFWWKGKEKNCIGWWPSSHMFRNIANCEIDMPCTVNSSHSGKKSLIGATDDWYQCRTLGKLYLLCPPVVASVQFWIQLFDMLLICELLCWCLDEIFSKWEMAEKKSDSIKRILIVIRVFHFLSVFNHNQALTFPLPGY
jgi:hypothetical protein